MSIGRNVQGTWRPGAASSRDALFMGLNVLDFLSRDTSVGDTNLVEFIFYWLLKKDDNEIIKDRKNKKETLT